MLAMDNDVSKFDEIKKTVISSVEPKICGLNETGTQFVVVPDGYTVKSLEEMRPSPLARKGIVNIFTADSFIDYVTRYANQNTTAIFADLDRKRIVAVLDFHREYQGESQSNLSPQYGWCKDKVSIDFKETREWREWVKHEKNDFGQLELADFFEKNNAEIIEPEAAKIVEFITCLRIKRNATFESVVDSNTGFMHVSFSENIKGSTINSSSDFFSKFTLAISPFEGSAKYKAHCLLRMNITSENKLSLFYTITNMDAIVEDCFSTEVERIKNELEHIPFFNGSF